LLAELHVAKELGMTLGQLRREMTYEELWLWLTYFGLMNDQQEEQMKKARRGRR
jgi:citrate synthase